MSEISKVIASEIADFFAGFGGPGEPDIQNGEAQRLLTELVLSVLALRERAEPVAYADPQAFRNFQAGTANKEWMWAQPGAGLVPVFVKAPPAPVVKDKCECWYLVSWCGPGGRFGCTEVSFDNPWVLGSMRGVQEIVADANDLDSRTVVILSAFPIAAAHAKN